MAEQIAIGDSVVCDDDFFEFDAACPFKMGEVLLPKADETYTVRAVVQTPNGPGIRLNEIVNKRFYYAREKETKEPIFDITRFHKA